MVVVMCIHFGVFDDFSIGLHLALVPVPSGLLWLCNMSFDLER